jgi:YegS/Rv2252/BmrU family lipid kinase
MRALVVVNPIAGPGRTRAIGACVDLARTVLTAHHYDTDVQITTGPDDARRFALEAVAANADVVIAWGGDGTVNGAASALADTGIPLAIIPGGSGNGLARDLLIPLNARKAFEIAATGKVRAIDAGDLHGSLFFNVAGIGFDARIANRLAEPGAQRGLVGYVVATISELRGYEPGCYSIRQAFDVDGKQLTADIIDHHALFIALANSRQYGSGAQIAPTALLDDGLMEIVVVEPQSGFSILKQVPAFFRGTLREGPGILMRSAAAMEISSALPIPFHVDGEPRKGPNSIRLQTRRMALLVKVR